MNDNLGCGSGRGLSPFGACQGTMQRPAQKAKEVVREVFDEGIITLKCMIVKRTLVICIWLSGFFFFFCSHFHLKFYLITASDNSSTSSTAFAASRY